LKNNRGESLSPWKPGIDPVALLCDLAVLAVLVAAAWNALRVFPVRFSLADLFAVTTSFAVMLSFHIAAWDRHFDLSQLAIDVGAFSVAIAMIRMVRKIAATLSLRRAGHTAIVQVPGEPEQM
jgi:hypothetical protein